jgi:hypothetical protein
MEDVGIFYGHLVHFTVFSYILWTFDTVRDNLVYFSHFGILYLEKSGNPTSYIRRPSHSKNDAHRKVSRYPDMPWRVAQWTSQPPQE